MRNLVRSPLGLVLRTFRDVPRAAEASGINLDWVRSVVYLLTSMVAAYAGALLAFSQQFVNAQEFGIGLALMLLAGVVLGGPGTLLGPLVGMIPLLAISFWIGPFSPFNAVFFGVGLLLVTILFPNGIVPVLLSRIELRKGGGDRRLPAAGTTPRHTAASEPVHVAGFGPGGPTKPPLLAGEQPPLLHVRGASKAFGPVVALTNVTLVVRAGTLVGLIGPNGSGKSTLLNAISGFFPVDGGTIDLNGTNIAGRPVYQIARLGIGRTFQTPQLVMECSVIENIAIGAIGRHPQSITGALFRSRGAASRASIDLERAISVFNELDLPSSMMSTPSGNLPLGLQRIVEIGRAVAGHPQLLLLDEPAAGLNDKEREHLGVMLRRLVSTGISILVVEHDVSFVTRYCDELVMLEDGRVACRAAIGSGDPIPARIADYFSHAPSLA
jgi:branched-chain amino acid transport system permease protein